MRRREFIGTLGALAASCVAGHAQALLLSGYQTYDPSQVIIAGDSRTAQSRFLTNTGSAFQCFEGQTSYLRYALSAAGNRLWFPVDGSYAYPAYRTGTLVQELSDASLALSNLGQWNLVTHPAENVVILIGETDVRNSIPLATMQANLTTILSTLSRKRIFLLNEIPVGINQSGGVQNNFTGAMLTQFVDWNNWLNTLASSRVIIVDSWNAIIDPATIGTTYYPLTGYLHDGLHNNSWGARTAGEVLGAAFTANLPAFDYAQLPASNSDTYDAVTNPWGCLNSNPLIPRTLNGGTKTSGGTGSVTGDVCTGYTVRTISGAGALDVVCSQVAGPDGYDEQVISWSGNTGAGQCEIVFSQDPSNGLINANDQIFTAARFRFDAAALTAVNTIGALASFSTSGSPSVSQSRCFDLGDVTGFFSGMGSVDEVLPCAPVSRARAAGTLLQTTVRGVIELAANSLTSGVVAISQFGARKWKFG